MGVGANVFLVGLVGVGYYIYASIDPTRADYPSPVNELYSRVAALPAVPYVVKTIWVVQMNQFGVRTSSETDKSVTWTYTYKDKTFGTYTINFVPNGDKSTTVFSTLEKFNPEIEGSLLTNADWGILRAVARDVTYEQVFAALTNRTTSYEAIRKHQSRILLNLPTIKRLQTMNEADVGAIIKTVKDSTDDAVSEAQASAAINGEGGGGDRERGDVGGAGGSMEQ